MLEFPLRSIVFWFPNTQTARLYTSLGPYYTYLRTGEIYPVLIHRSSGRSYPAVKDKFDHSSMRLNHPSSILILERINMYLFSSLNLASPSVELRRCSQTSLLQYLTVQLRTLKHDKFYRLHPHLHTT
jgi:hypothetical protein